MKSEFSDADVAEIAAKLGRPLRVLHIGNIANNGYNNARIQRQYGIDADILCFDYYHVMGSPEWEDGSLTTRPDPDLPNWWETNIGGFKRPDWYVQGPLALCLEYLDAHRRKQNSRKARAAAQIEDAYIDMLRLRSESRGLTFSDPRTKRATRTFHPLRALANYIADSRRRAHSAVEELRLRVIWPALAAAMATPPRISGARAVLAIYGMTRRASGREALTRPEMAAAAAKLLPRDSAIVEPVGLLVLRGLRLVGKALSSQFLAAIAESGSPQKERHARNTIAKAVASQLLSDPRVGSVSAERRSEIVDQIADHSLLFGKILRHYDVIQGYSIDGFIPLVNGSQAFTSYEHGTLRELPFEDSRTGLMCRIAYLNSPAVFVTNTDVLPSVERLALNPETVHHLPHAFDDQKLRNWRDTNSELSPPSDHVVFFSPTRHHWQDASPSLTKGNNIMLKAAGRLWGEGRRFKLVLVEWGQDVGASKGLINSLGYSDAVTWVQPMGKQDLWRTYCTSHAVLDQFTLRALGGVGFEALTLGRRLITYTDQATLSCFFGAAPPVLPAGSVNEVTHSMARVLDDPLDLDGIGDESRQWIIDYHSAKRTVSLQARVYRRLLDATSLASGALPPKP